MKRVVRSLVLVASVVLAASSQARAQCSRRAPDPGGGCVYLTEVSLIAGQCASPLGFKVVVHNTSPTDFTERVALVVTGAGARIGERLSPIAAASSQTVILSSPNLLADCSAEQCYRISLAAGTDGCGAVVGWDGTPLDVCTRPGRVEWSLRRPLAEEAVAPVREP